MKIKSSHTIDVVIAWVDGADPKHKKKRLSFLDNKDVGELAGAAETRFNSLNEVEYCVLSILKFAPFVRNIYIVTDNQDPKIVSAVKKYFPERQKDIRIVDHKEIFEGYEKFLPTFNSICISNMLWRIKGLSNHFVYFNDDDLDSESVQNPEFYRLIYTNDTVETSDDISVVPTSVNYSPEVDLVHLQWRVDHYHLKIL